MILPVQPLLSISSVVGDIGYPTSVFPASLSPRDTASSPATGRTRRTRCISTGPPTRSGTSSSPSGDSREKTNRLFSHGYLRLWRRARSGFVRPPAVSNLNCRKESQVDQECIALSIKGDDGAPAQQEFFGRIESKRASIDETDFTTRISKRIARIGRLRAHREHGF